MIFKKCPYESKFVNIVPWSMCNSVGKSNQINVLINFRKVEIDVD